MKSLSSVFFPQMVMASANSRNPAPRVVTGEPKRLIPGSEWDVFNKINARPHKPGTNEYTEKGVDKTEK